MCSGCRTLIFSIMWSRTQSSLTRFYKIGFTGTILFLLAIMWRFEAPTNWMMVGKTSLRLLSPKTIHKKWIVVTSVSSPTEEIEKLSQIREWQLLVVADTKTPKNWTHPNAIMLDIDLQLKLGYHVLQHLPWNAYTRKIIGYLYAIQHGAEFIYDTDDDNAPNNPGTFEKDFVFEPRTRGLILDNNDNNIVTNPYVHFGQPLVWPRGFPHEYIGQSYNNTYTVGPMTTPLIQQGIVNGDPDVDAIYRLTRKKLVGNLNIKFDSRAPPVILPNRVLAPFNSQNTIFHYNTFWAMVLPVSVVFRVTDIWRGYWAQPLLLRVGGHFGFFSTNTTQLRNPHIYLRDFGEEDQLYKQAGHLTHFLSNWQCLSSQDLYNCMLELTSAMIDHKMWFIEEIQLMEAWIQDLKVIGYKAPSLRQQIQGTPWPWLKDKGETFAMFSPVEINSIDPEAEIDQFRGPLRNFCNFTISAHKNHTNETGTATFPSTLVVVTFNYPHYENIWLIDLAYRPHYPNILYCSTLQNVSILYNFLARKEFLSSNVKTFSFVHADVRGGNFAYECAVRAVDMKYNVNGYIVLSDDVLMNFWNNWKGPYAFVDFLGPSCFL